MPGGLRNCFIGTIRYGMFYMLFRLHLPAFFLAFFILANVPEMLLYRINKKQDKHHAASHIKDIEKLPSIALRCKPGISCGHHGGYGVINRIQPGPSFQKVETYNAGDEYQCGGIYQDSVVFFPKKTSYGICNHLSKFGCKVRLFALQKKENFVENNCFPVPIFKWLILIYPTQGYNYITQKIITIKI